MACEFEYNGKWYNEVDLRELFKTMAPNETVHTLTEQEYKDFNWSKTRTQYQLSVPIREAVYSLEVLSVKDKMTLLSTAESLVANYPLKYLTILKKGEVILNTSLLSRDVKKELGESIIPEKVRDEAQAFHDSFNNKNYEDRLKQDKERIENAIDHYSKLVDKIQNILNDKDTTAEKLFNTLVETPIYSYQSHRDVNRSFDLRASDNNVYNYHFTNNELVSISKQYVKYESYSGKPGAEKHRLIGYNSITAEENEDEYIAAMQEFQLFKNNKSRIIKAINKLLLDPLIEYRDNAKSQTPLTIEEAIENEREISYEQISPYDILEMGMEQFLKQDLIANNIIDNEGYLTKDFGVGQEQLLSDSNDSEYNRVKANQDLIKKIIANKEDYNTELDQWETEDSDMMAPMPGWFVNAVSVERNGKLFDEIKGFFASIIKTMIMFSAQEQYDNFHDNGITPDFQKLADTNNILTYLPKRIRLKPVVDTYERASLFNQIESLAKDLNIERVVNVKNLTSPKTEDELRRDYYEGLLNKFASKFNLKWAEDNDQPSIGRFQNGTVYINFNKIKADTVFHEFLHPFEQAVKKQNPTLWKSLAARANKVVYDGTNIADRVKQNYPELVGEDLQSEIIVTALGLYAADSSLETFKPVKSLIKTFLDKLINMFKNLFSDRTLDLSDSRLLHLSFRELTDMLFDTETKLDLSKENDNKEWNQKSDEVFASLKGLQDDLVRNADHKYIYKGEELEGSVHSMVVDPYYEEIFGDKDFTEAQKQRNEILKELGNELHKIMEDIFYTHIDPATGIKRDKVLETKRDRNLYYNTLEAYFEALMSQFQDENPRFMSEVRLVDPKKKMGGTTDLLIITDSGVRMYDWKSIQTRAGKVKIDDIPFFKEEAYRKQLGAYKDMIQKYTGSRVVYAAAIPIEANATFKIENGNPTNFKIKEFMIGEPDPRLIDDDKNYLLPIVFKDQTTGDKLLDAYIKRLYGMIDRIAKESVAGDAAKRERKIRILNGLRSSIRSLQVRMNVANFKETATLYLREAKSNIEKTNPNKSYLLDLQDMLEIFRDASSSLRGILPELDLASLNNDNTDEGKIISAISDTAGRLMTDLKEKIKEVGEENASSYGIQNLLSPQKSLDALKRNMRSISTMPIKTVEVLWQMLKRFQHTRDINTRDLFKDLKDLEVKFKKWADSKGQSAISLIDKLLDHDKDGKQTGQFLRHYSKEYWVKRAEAIKKDDIAWILNNTVFDEVAFRKYAANQTAWINSQEYYVDPVKNQAERDKKISEIYRFHDPIKLVGGIETGNSEAILNSSNQFLIPSDKFITKEWKELHKDENKPLLDVYNKFQAILKEAQSYGMIEWRTDYTFIPNIQTNALERLLVNGVSEAFDMSKMLASITTNSDQGFMKIDPVNGKPEKAIPLYFQQSLVKKDKDGNVIDNTSKSTYLFKVFAIFGAHVYDYKMKQDIEDDANILLEVEKEKETYQTNVLNEIKRDPDGNPIPIKGKGEASEVYKVLEDYVNFYVYNQADNKDFVKKIGKLEISGRKSLSALQSWMSLKILSFNVPSAFANLFGGKANSYFEAAKKIHFNEQDIVNSSYLLTSADKKAWAMIEYLNIFLDDTRREMANKLSLFNSEKILDSNYLMILQRGTDKLVQLPNALAVTMNYMVDEDGKIVSIKKYVRNKNNYEGSYALPKEEKDALDSKISKEVNELKKTKSIFAIGKLTDKGFSIPGVKEDSRELANFRAKIKKINKTILGNSTKDDITRIRLSLIGQLFMQFRNWMPQMVTERLGDYNYDSDLEQFTYGKTRMFFKHMFSKNVLGLTKDLIFGLGTNTIEAAKARYAQIAEELHLLGQEMQVTETEFIDLYISNIRSQMRELMVILAGGALLFSAFSAADDDKDGWKKMARRTTKRLLNELTFYYSPDNFTNIVKSPVPVVKLAQDIQNFAWDGLGQIIGFVGQSEEKMDKNHPGKYFANLFPITKELILWWATLDEDFRREHNIKIVN